MLYRLNDCIEHYVAKIQVKLTKFSVTILCTVCLCVCVYLYFEYVVN